MGKFKVGDKVRVLPFDDADISNLGIKDGDIGVINDIYAFAETHSIEVYFTIKELVQDCCFDETELELVNDE